MGSGRKPRHGMDGTRLYKTHENMKRRCLVPNCKNYKDYGGRGIKVCDEWIVFDSFMNWALTNGYKDDLFIDRIDTNGNYEPSNCRFVTRKENNNNRRDNYKITFNGTTKTASQWADIMGVRKETIKLRIKNGWSISESFSNINSRTGGLCKHG